VRADRPGSTSSRVFGAEAAQTSKSDLPTRRCSWP
jgi:hypothetical protein